MLEIMIEELKSAAKDFYNTTGIKIALWDEGRNLLYIYPKNLCTFCQTVRDSEALAAHCFDCDHSGFDMCEKTGKPFIYKCHMGLTEATAPIYENGILIGYMMMPQILCEEDRETVLDAVRAASDKYGLDAGRLADAFADLKNVKSDFIRSAVNLMSMCVCYLHVNKIIRSTAADHSAMLKNLVDQHYAEALTVPELCRRMYISRSKLYNLSLETFGMGISDYIRKKRIAEAKKLLDETELSVAHIAEKVGFRDSNYFTRTFKQEENLTPSEYRMQKAARNRAQ